MAWDKTKPAGASDVSEGDDSIRANWVALEASLGAEHQFSSSNQDCYHLEGSARITVCLEAEKAALDKEEGRLCFCTDSKTLYYAAGDAWVQLNPLTINGQAFLYPTGEDSYTTTSTSFADIDTNNFKVTLTTKGGHLLVFLAGMAKNSTDGKSVFFNVSLDDTDLTNITQGFCGVIPPNVTVEAEQEGYGGDIIVTTTILAQGPFHAAVRTTTAPAAGSHTLRGRWRVDGGTGLLLPNYKNMLAVVEI